MSWSEPAVQDFIKQCSCTWAFIAACQVGKDWAKAWLFAGTSAIWETLAEPCNHPLFSHQNIAGVRTKEGTYLSRETAEYPPALCQAFASAFSNMFSQNQCQIDWSNMESLLPIKPLDAPPFARQDGGGISFADWSGPPAGSIDIFKSLRQRWFQLILDQRLDKQIMAHLSEQRDSPPFTSIQLEPFRASLVEFLRGHQLEPDWTIAADQPMHLSILASIASIMRDPDTALHHWACPVCLYGCCVLGGWAGTFVTSSSLCLPGRFVDPCFGFAPCDFLWLRRLDSSPRFRPWRRLDSLRRRALEHKRFEQSA